MSRSECRLNHLPTHMHCSHTCSAHTHALLVHTCTAHTHALLTHMHCSCTHALLTHMHCSHTARHHYLAAEQATIKSQHHNIFILTSQDHTDNSHTSSSLDVVKARNTALSGDNERTHFQHLLPHTLPCRILVLRLFI